MGGAHWALEDWYVTQKAHFIAKWTQNCLICYSKCSHIVAPKMSQRFMFCISEIFFKNFERFSLKCSNFVNF